MKHEKVTWADRKRGAGAGDANPASDIERRQSAVRSLRRLRSGRLCCKHATCM